MNPNNNEIHNSVISRIFHSRFRNLCHFNVVFNAIEKIYYQEKNDDSSQVKVVKNHVNVCF